VWPCELLFCFVGYCMAGEQMALYALATGTNLMVRADAVHASEVDGHSQETLFSLAGAGSA